MNVINTRALQRPALVIALAATLVAIVLAPYWPATALILRASGARGSFAMLAQWQARPVTHTIDQIRTRSGNLRGRIFRPAGSARGAALLVSGVHPGGIDEPRLVSLSDNLAATGLIVLTPEIPDLTTYQLTPRVTDAIEDAAIWLSNRKDLSGSGRVGLIGVSFSGGLSMVAAGRHNLRDRVAYVLSAGGHGNLPRVLRYLCTGIEPPAPGQVARLRPPHDYALAVIAHQASELAVPAEQVPLLRRAIEEFVEGSALARTNSRRSREMFASARLSQSRMPEPSASLMKLVNDRDVAHLGARLLPYVDRLGQDPSLSPDRSTPPSAPVYLLHGADDNVIPAVESALLADSLKGTTRVRRLLSPALTHVDIVARPSWRDRWAMVAFWKAALADQ